MNEWQRATGRPVGVLKKAVLVSGCGLLCVMVVLLLFEIIHHTQLIDTYRPELRGFNDPDVLENAEW